LSRRIRLESFNSLILPNEGHDRCDIVSGEPVDRLHIAEAPMMLPTPLENGEEKGGIAVVAGFIDPRKV
jgi:hypothetical protein